MPKAPQKLIVIDGNALIHRSFHALPLTMTTKAGEPTNAVYGFTTVLMKAMKELKADYIVLTLDRKEKTFRHEAYADYKGKRVKAPDELYAQFPRVKEIARAFNIPIFEKAGFEADDLIGTITTQVKDKRLKLKYPIESIIVTGDMDTLQLVDAATKVYTMSRGLSDSLIYDAAAVVKRFDGLQPGQMTDYKALRGDPSDNIPGVPGIGEKGAIELIKNFGSLEKLYDHVERDSKQASALVKPRIRELLKQYKKEAFFSKTLVTIDCNVPIAFDLQKARAGDFNINEVSALFTELEFKSLLPRLQELHQKLRPAHQAAEDEQLKFAYATKNFQYELIDTQTSFQAFLRELAAQKIFAFDTETANFNPLEAQLLGISFSWKKNQAYYVAIKNQRSKIKNQNTLFDEKKNSNVSTGIELTDVVRALKPLFENPDIKKIGHNIKFDVEALESNGLRVEGIYFDTMLAAYLLNPGTRQHGLDATSLHYLGHVKISKDDLLGTGRHKTTFAQAPVERLSVYSCEDADCTFQMYGRLAEELKKEALHQLFFDIEMPLIRVLADMEQAGISVNTAYLATLQKEFAKRIKILTEKIHDLAGKPFNINSTQQLQEILFERLNIPTHLVKRTKTGYSTGADELAKLRGQHEIIDCISQYRELTKLQSTYVEALPKMVTAQDKRLHTNYNQTIAATGRLSSTDPNLQNIPIRTEEGRKIRQAFVARRGWRLVSADYSQIELRLAAALSQDKTMIEAFAQNKDIHTATAAAINDVDLADVTKEMRREAKAINFGIIYGQGAFGLAQTADIPQWRAKEFIDKYFATYRGIKKFIDTCIASAQKTQKAQTLFGRIRRIPEINSGNMQIRKGAERVAINMPLQGTAADIMKLAMIRVHRALQKHAAHATVLLQVHDELVLEVQTAHIPRIAGILKQEMQNVIKLAVPITVDVSVGDNWEEMEEIV